MEVFFIVCFVALVIAAVVYSAIAAQKRKKELSALAAGWGFQWSEDDPFGIAGRHYRYKALSRGDDRYAYNVFHGELQGRRVICFDFHYETHSTDSKGRRQTHHHRFSGALIGLGAVFPYLYVRPEGFLDKVAEFVGMDDIDFESAEFSRKYFVKSENRRFAYDIFHARAMEFMLARPIRAAMEFLGDSVLVSQDRLWDRAGFEAAVLRVEGLLDLIPEFVWKSLKEGGA